MKEIGPTAGIDCKNIMTKINCEEGTDCQSTTKINMKESIIIHFRIMEIGENIKIIIKNYIRMKIYMTMINPIWTVLLGHMTETGYIIETGTIPKNTKETGHTTEIDCMTEIIHIAETGLIVEIDCETTVEMSIREEHHKYKRRSRDYYEDIYENRHSMDKYECQFRNDNYDIIKGRPKEKSCPCSDQSCDSFYSELKKWYSSTVALDVQDVHNLPTNIVDELELSDIHLIEQYIWDKEEMEAQEMEECIVELSDKQEIDKEMVVLPNMPEKTSCEQEECVEMKTYNMSLLKLV